MKIDRIFHLLFLEDDVGRKWIEIEKSRRYDQMLAQRKHDKMQSQNGIRIPAYVAASQKQKKYNK